MSNQDTKSNDILNVAEKILNYFHANYYNGSEHDYITLMYFDNIYWDVCDLLAKNANYFQENKVTNFITNKIEEAKKRTLDRRLKFLKEWESSFENKICTNNKFMLYLVKTYNVSQKEEVKKELGL